MMETERELNMEAEDVTPLWQSHTATQGQDIALESDFLRWNPTPVKMLQMLLRQPQRI